MPKPRRKRMINVYMFMSPFEICSRAGFAQGYNSAQIQSSAGHFCGRMAGWDFVI